MDQGVEGVLQNEYETLLAGFKPEFGNQRHIDIQKCLAKISEKEKLLNVKQASARGAEQLQGELSVLKRQVVHLLKSH